MHDNDQRAPEASCSSTTTTEDEYQDYQKLDINYDTWLVPRSLTDLCHIASGLYGSVCSARLKASGRYVAVKRLTLPVRNAYRAEHTFRELHILRLLSHPAILDLSAAFTPDPCVESLRDVYLVTPLMDIDLARVLATQRLSYEHVRYIAYQLLCGLQYIHSAGVIHRDLKPNNIGINSDCRVRILDFGEARMQEKRMSGYVVMRYYRAPEITWNWSRYEQRSDMWSFACILAEMVTGRPIFPGRNLSEQLWRFCSVLGSPEPELVDRMPSSAAKSCLVQFPNIERSEMSDLIAEPETGMADVDISQLLDHMLVWDPNDRPSAESILAHRYFHGVRSASLEKRCSFRLDLSFTNQRIRLPEWKRIIWNEIQKTAVEEIE